MSTERERFDAGRAAVSAPTPTGPRAERYASALTRYLTAVAQSGSSRGTADYTLRDERSWHLKHVLVRDVMTTPVTAVRANAPFHEIVGLLARERVDALPVIDAERKVLGVVSESDLLASVIAGTESAATQSTHSEATARMLMHSPAITTRPRVSVIQAARTAALAHLRRLPVLDEKGQLVGIVALTDLLRVLLHDHTSDDRGGQPTRA